MPILYDAELELKISIRNAEAGSDKHQDINEEVKRVVRKIVEQTVDPKVNINFYPSSMYIHNIRNTDKTTHQMLDEHNELDSGERQSSTTDFHGKPDSHPAQHDVHKKENEAASPKDTAKETEKYLK